MGEERHLRAPGAGQGAQHAAVYQLNYFDIVFIDVITFIFNMFIIIKNNIINSTNYRAALAKKLALFH